jgi:hypothetical protein
MDAVFVNFEKDIIELRQHINYIKSISLKFLMEAMFKYILIHCQIDNSIINHW